jgi:hypothetical protein
MSGPNLPDRRVRTRPLGPTPATARPGDLPTVFAETDRTTTVSRSGRYYPPGGRTYRAVHLAVDVVGGAVGVIVDVDGDQLGPFMLPAGEYTSITTQNVVVPDGGWVAVLVDSVDGPAPEALVVQLR